MSADLERLEGAVDYESKGRSLTASKALLLMARGAHVSGFVLRPDDGLSDVAIVSNGVTRFLSPGEMQWLMHESAGRSILVDASDEVENLKARLEGALLYLRRMRGVLKLYRVLHDGRVGRKAVGGDVIQDLQVQGLERELDQVIAEAEGR